MFKDECHHNSRQFSIKQTFTGKLVIMVRYAKADISPATWAYGPWQYADISELPELIRKLGELSN